MQNLALDRASRNARTIAWLANQPTETKDDIRRFYAGHLGCPLDEVFSFDSPDPAEAPDDDTLRFVYSLFASQIDR